MRVFLASAVLAGLPFVTPAHAIIIADNSSSPINPAANSSAPADSLGDPGFKNIGWRDFSGGATAVYIGNRYVLTAAHVGAGSVIFGTDDPSGGTTYQPVVDGSNNPIETRFTNPGGGLSDLLLFRLTTDPGLPGLTLTSSALPLNALVRMIGTGRTRGSGEQNSTDLPPAGGYFWGPNRDKTWGDNGVSQTASLTGDGSGGSSVTFRTTFFDSSTFANAQLADKDSGSAAFAFNVDHWELVGIGSAITVYPEQLPSGGPTPSPYAQASEYGQSSLFLDLNSYRSQFPADVPEPSGAALVGLIGAAWLARRRR